MSRVVRIVAWLILASAMIAADGCDTGGIGLNVPNSGARISGPGPDVMVGGGPR
jgi:hypothetical protein